jgi:hypothetical protein
VRLRKQGGRGNPESSSESHLVAPLEGPQRRLNDVVRVRQTGKKGKAYEDRSCDRAGLAAGFELESCVGVSSHVAMSVAEMIIFREYGFLSKQFFIGLVGYAYEQVSADSGSGDLVDAFESRVFSVGPQLGYIFPIAGKQGFLGLKSYFEFDAKTRPRVGISG